MSGVPICGSGEERKEEELKNINVNKDNDLKKNGNRLVSTFNYKKKGAKNAKMPVTGYTWSSLQLSNVISCRECIFS